MTFRVFKISSKNTPLYYLDFITNENYLSQILHKYISQYKKHVFEDTKYNIAYYVIYHNDVSIDLVDTFDSPYITEQYIHNIENADDNCINNKHYEIEDKVYRFINTTLRKKKFQDKIFSKEYYNNYYLNNKEKFNIKDKAKTKKYYQENKPEILRKAKLRRDTQKLNKWCLKYFTVN